MYLFLQRALEIGIEERLLIQMSDFDLDGICKIRINDWIKLTSDNTQWKVIGFEVGSTQC